MGRGAETLFSLLCLLGPQAPPRASEETLAARAARGQELMSAGRYAEAASVYRELVRALPKNPGLLLNLGMALHLSGRNDEAAAPLAQALQMQPDSFPAALFLGLAELGRGQPAGAVKPLERAAQLDPKDGDARAALAEALLALGRVIEAEAQLHRLTGLRPRDPKAWFNLGKTYEELAGQAFRDLQERDPESPLLLAIVAEGRAEQGRTQEAFHLYRLALERAPILRGVHAAIAVIYRDAGHADWAEAEGRKERALPLPDCARETLECAFRDDKPRDALVAAARDKSDAALYWLARAAEDLAGRAYERLTALPPSAEAHEWTAQKKASLGRFEESAAEWRKAVALDPREPRLKFELALALRQARDLEAAQAVLEDLLRSDPGYPEASYLLGDVLLAQQKADRAVPHLEAAVRLDPEGPATHGALGRAYALVGRPSEAIPHLERALAGDADGSIRFQLARSYRMTGQAERADATLREYEALRKAAPREAEAPSVPPLTPP